MRIEKRIFANVIYIILGVCLFVLGFFDVVDGFWSGMGGALIAVGAVRMIQMLRYSKDEAYREKAQIEAKDERNQFLRNKAWAWAAYLFVLIAAAAAIALQLLGQALLSMTAGFGSALLFVLYWICYMVLKKKY